MVDGLAGCGPDRGIGQRQFGRGAQDRSTDVRVALGPDAPYVDLDPATDSRSRDPPKQLKAPNLSQPGEVATKRPGLYLTEFGYKNRPTRDFNRRRKPGRDNGDLYWHIERYRANWFAGWRGHKGALDLAGGAKAKRFTLYHAIEVPPLPLSDARVNGDAAKGDQDDAGLFQQNGVITGIRGYGKDKERHPTSFRTPQERLAYCAIRGWAIRRGYFASPFPSTYRNACD